jgi:hypothetical protein
VLAQLAYGGSRWGIAAGYRYGQCEASFRTGTDFTAANSFWQHCETITEIAVAGDGTVQGLKREGRSGASSHSLALNAYWQPRRAGWIPSISAGWALASLSGRQVDLKADSTTLNLDGRPLTLTRAEIEGRVPVQFQSWMVGLQWRDVLAPGNDLGVAVGQPQFVTRLKGGGTPFDGNTAWELWYQIQISDAISLTPAVFYLSRPQGNLTGPAGRNRFSVFGGLVQTVFRF